MLVIVSGKHIRSDLVNLIISFALHYFSEALLVHGHQLFLEIDDPFEIEELRHLLSWLFVGLGNLIDGSFHELGEYLLLEWIERVDLDHQIKEQQFLLHVIYNLFENLLFFLVVRKLSLLVPCYLRVVSIVNNFFVLLHFLWVFYMDVLLIYNFVDFSLELIQVKIEVLLLGLLCRDVMEVISLENVEIYSCKV